jgi:hypothetical protein
LNQALDQFVAEQPDALRDLVAGAFEQEKEKTAWVTSTCKHCKGKQREEVVVRIPDYQARARAIETLLNQAKGKPAERKTVTVDVTHRGLEQLADDELRQLASGRAEVVDAEFRELPEVAGA